MSLFNRENIPWKVPVWFMRQAGRYHSHYQNIKKDSNFMEMCKKPELACEVTMGPIEDFNFDAAILFSDLLFPLEQMNLGLEYSPGPKLHKHLKEASELNNVEMLAPANDFYKFQADALTLLKERLPQEKTLLGFVGAPFTLYTYAVEGSHAGSLFKAKRGLYNGLFDAFCEKLIPELLDNMSVQANGGADAMCLFDTAIGELTLKDFKEIALPYIKKITAEFKKRHPNKKLIYYSKHTHMHHLHAIQDDNIDVLGVDWRHQLNDVFKEFGNDYYIQGNFDPCWLHLDWKNCEANLLELLGSVDDKFFDRWIMGLGHGVLIETPEENVRHAVSTIHDFFKN